MILTLATAYAIGAVCLRRLAAPRVLALAVGAAILSTLVFLLLLTGLANRPAFALLTLLGLVIYWRAGFSPRGASAPPKDQLIPYSILAIYSLFYFVHALAPEVQPDGTGYHLGLVSEYFRRGQFPSRIGFYEMVPQGMEMLYLHAYAFGGGSSAKLVHFGLLLATVPLLVSIGRRLALPDAVSLTAATLYFCTPVVGVTATSTYNDPALVFFVLATFYALLAWRETRSSGWLAVAGLTAGFCYAIKLPGLIVPLAAALYVLASGGRWRIAILAGAALLTAAPWLVRNAVLTGNPLAPLFNTWFPNPYFHAFSEQALKTTLASYGGVPLWRAPWELAAGNALQGSFGPLFLAVPLGLLALRNKAGRLCWLAAGLLAIPWFSNIGARFLLPSLPFLWLAFAMPLPRAALWACLVFQAVTCWPAAIDLYATHYPWRLRGFPWQAALRLQSEPQFLAANLGEFHLARLLNDEVPPTGKVLALTSVATAFTSREVLEYWHSAEADRLTDTIKVAGPWAGAALYDVRAEWPAQPIRGLRWRLSQSHPGEWDIQEIRLYSGPDRIRNSPQWTLTASPNPWELPSALDDNLATRWRTWEPMRAGMTVQIDFDRPQRVTAAVMISHTPYYGVPIECAALTSDGWRVLATPRADRHPTEDLRRLATHAIQRAGYSYILVPTTEEGYAPVGRSMLADLTGWGLEEAGQYDRIYLLRIR